VEVCDKRRCHIDLFVCLSVCLFVPNQISSTVLILTYVDTVTNNLSLITVTVTVTVTVKIIGTTPLGVGARHSSEPDPMVSQTVVPTVVTAHLHDLHDLHALKTTCIRSDKGRSIACSDCVLPRPQPPPCEPRDGSSCAVAGAAAAKAVASAAPVASPRCRRMETKSAGAGAHKKAARVV